MKHPGILIIAALLIIPAVAFAHGISHPGVLVRVASYNPLTNEYNISCTIPPNVPGSQVDPRRFYAIDPVPQGHNQSYRTYDPTFVWRLDPVNFTELVHTKAMYHMYCEVQNYSAPPGEQNMPSEFHIDLRTSHNIDVPNIYVLQSDGPSLTMKCDPPPGTKDFNIAWSYRNRAGTTSLPALANQRIVNITLPEVGGGWDVVCSVFDKQKGTSSSWDMPLEVFASGPAYVPTIEGCLPNQPCYQVSPSGFVPNGTLQLTTLPGTAVYINEAFKGTTSTNGQLAIGSIVPGIYNLVLRKDGYEELSTLIPIATGKTLTRSYPLQTLTNATNASGNTTCYSNVQSLPASCTGGTITEDSSSGCRKIVCAGSGGSIQVLACNKPDGNPDHFEMYKQSQTGTAPKVCLGPTCIQNEGFVASPKYPICIGNATQPPPPPQSCTYNGTARASGSSFPATDGCNTCTCNNGAVTCSTNTCTPPPPPPSNSTCYNSVQGIPATCNGGTITQDTFSGCRRIVCQSSSAGLQVLACNKPDGSPQYFEMYKQTVAGSGPLGICIGSTCITMSGGGYAKSANYPVCVGNTTAPGNTTPPPPNTTNTTQPPSNQTNTTNTTQPPNATNQSVSVGIAPWYPKGRDYIFVCNAQGFTPTSYDWSFGDGQKQPNSQSNNVYHRYAAAGQYAVMCTAKSGLSSGTGALNIIVT